ncbi:MAG: phosphatase PAP2 family protein [Alphaproteobacteria bacterium]|nr:phosphatase PAP2 family protein [Alphaproteobacteria bacterium]
MRKALNFIFVITLFFCVAHSSGNAGPFKDKNKLGDLFMVMSPTYAFGMTVANEDYHGMMQLAESVVAAQITSEGIKALELEERPNHSDKKSFPSGHATGAFSGAMFVHKRYGWKPALIPYGMSLVAGWSRTDVKAHYWHDVLGGAAISALFTWVLVDEYSPKGLSVNADSQGVNLKFSTTF